MRYLTTIIFLALLITFTGEADEKLRIAGMGGVKAGMNAPDSGIFGNPAALLEVVENNLSLAFSVENYQYEKLPETDAIQFAATLNFDSRPSVYYSRAFDNFGIAVGYATTLNNFAESEIERTRSEYLVDQRQFSAATNLVTDYNLLWESSFTIGFSKRLKESLIGFRLKRVSQTAKRGQILSLLNIESQHSSDVNINDPRELIPAIIDNVDFTDPAQYFDSVDKPSQDLTVSKFEVDLGYQRDFSIEALGNRPLRAGLIVENLFQQKLVRQLPLKFGIGAAYEPLNWIAVGADIWRVLGHRGLDFAVGWELHELWTRGFKGAATLRSGLSRIDATAIFSVGASFALGSLHWEYTLNKRFKGQTLGEATHLFASTVRF